MFGVLFLIEVILIAYIWFADPFNIKTMVNGGLPGGGESIQALDQHPLLDSTQESVLSGLGVDVANLSTEMTPELQECLTNAVGAERAQEIMNGATPGVMDVLKAKICLEY